MAIQTIILFLNSTLLFILGVYIWQRPVRGKKFFTLLLIAAGFLSFMGGVENIVLEINHKILCSKIGYLGTVSIGPLWFLFTLQYSLHKKSIYRKFSHLLITISTIILVFVFTNQFHNYIWTDITLASEVYNSPLIFFRTLHIPVFVSSIIQLLGHNLHITLLLSDFSKNKAFIY